MKEQEGTRPSAPSPSVCRAPGRCPGLWCRLMRRCFQQEAAADNG